MGKAHPLHPLSVSDQIVNQPTFADHPEQSTVRADDETFGKWV
jgi:hypothetical protein